MCKGADRDFSKKRGVAVDFEPNRKVAKTFSVCMVTMSVIAVIKGQSQDEFKASLGYLGN